MDDGQLFMSCNKRTASDIQKRIITILKFISNYKWIMDAYVSDFFIHNFWSRLPVSWTQYLEELSPPDISFLLRNDVNTFRKVPPLSLLAYRECVLTLALRRHPVDLDNEEVVQEVLISLEADCDSLKAESEVKSSLTKSGSADKSSAENGVSKASDTHHAERPKVSDTLHAERPEVLSSLETESDLRSLGTNPSRGDDHSAGCEGSHVSSTRLANRPEWRGVMKNGQWMELEHVYRKHVKPKKQHEIQKLSQTISYLCCQSQCSQVVDVGAGLGHLSRLLTFGHGVKVTTVEASGGHAPKATKFDRQTKKDIRKVKLKKQKLDGTVTEDMCEKPPVDLPSHISCRIHPNISTSHFLDLIRQSRRQQQQTDTVEPGGHLAYPEKYRQDFGRTKLSEECHVNNCIKDANLNQMDFLPQRTVFEKDLQCEKCQKQQTYCKVTKICEHANQNIVGCECKHSDSCNQNDKVQNTNRSHSEDEDASEDEDVSEDDAVDDDEQFVLAGLHACGDLTPTLIRMFVNCEVAGGLASVGCCYMKLSIDSCRCAGSQDSCEDPGYPMSQFVCGLQDSGLTYSARELTCHFADSYIQRLIENPPHLKVHCYRAAVQHLIVSLLPHYQHGAVRLTVKNATDLPFHSYAKKALQKLGYTSEIPGQLLQEAESYLPFWKDVVVFYTLRLCLAPVIETLILLDRMLFLHEHGISSVLMPIFDPKLSPRNFVLLAMKK